MASSTSTPNSTTSSAPPMMTSTGGTDSASMLQHQQHLFAQEFWQAQIEDAERFDSDFKNHPLPLARIKKVMKSDPDVKMISSEAPILFSKACEIFICEITRRAWLHAEANKRRTLQRSDVANAVSRSDQFDFLIDIVPREEAAPKVVKRTSTMSNNTQQGSAMAGGLMMVGQHGGEGYADDERGTIVVVAGSGHGQEMYDGHHHHLQQQQQQHHHHRHQQQQYQHHDDHSSASQQQQHPTSLQQQHYVHYFPDSVNLDTSHDATAPDSPGANTENGGGTGGSSFVGNYYAPISHEQIQHYMRFPPQQQQHHQQQASSSQH